MQEMPPDESTFLWLKLLISGLLGWLLRGLLEQQNVIRSRINENRASKLIGFSDSLLKFRTQNLEFRLWLSDWDGEFVSGDPPLSVISAAESQDAMEMLEMGILGERDHGMLTRIYDCFTYIGLYDKRDSLRFEREARDELLHLALIAEYLWNHADRRLNRRLGISKYRGLAALPSFFVSIWLWAFSDIPRIIRDNWEEVRLHRSMGRKIWTLRWFHRLTLNQMDSLVEKTEAEFQKAHNKFNLDS